MRSEDGGAQSPPLDGTRPGFDVVYVKRDSRDGGVTCSVYRDDDTRSLEELAFARATSLIGAVDHEPGFLDGQMIFCADRDVQKTFALAEAGHFRVESASAYGREIRSSHVFRERHNRGVDALIHKTYLDRYDLARILI